MGDVPRQASTVDNRVAIIGMAARFPGARNIDQLWENLVSGTESLTALSDAQLASAGVPASAIGDPNYIRLRPLTDDVDCFDAKYFGYSAREAQIADPQQRLFLEICETALQHAGYHGATYSGQVGVYGGHSYPTYYYKNVFANSTVSATVGSLTIDINNHHDYLATRVAFELGLTGPALSMATACSTSLVAVHLATRALLSGECTMALAGGVNVMIPYHAGQSWTEGSIYALDGHVRAFDAKASGTNFGHGAGAVVLKRLGDAVADGDTVHAVIIGSAINNDGRTKTNFSAPSAPGQTAVIKQALAVGGIAPDTIGYVEAHGTATPVGDPIEVAALSEAFRQAGATATQRCPIGSVKTNIGHLGPAAGVAGLIKTVLAVEHGQIPASLNCDTPNPAIRFEDTPFYVNRELSSWRDTSTPRRAGVSSFGIGGTNAHVILEQAPPAEPGGAGRPWQVLPLSAVTESALAGLRTNLADHLRANPGLNLADVAWTLQVGRSSLPQRAAITCQDVDDAIGALTRDAKAPAHTRGPAAVAFMFPGQGAQHVDMAEELYRTEPVFRDIVDDCSELLLPHLDHDLRDIMFSARSPDAGTRQLADRLRQTRFAQPALFVVEYALARLWMRWGVEPSAMVGHSVGEYVAACVADVFSLPCALELVALRGRLTQAMPSGSMLAVALPVDHLRPLLPEELDLAAVNGPRSCVVAGPTEEVERLADFLRQRGVQSHALTTSHAFHSAMLDPIVQPLRDAVAGVDRKPPTRRFASTGTGTWITDEQAVDPDYWAGHLRHTVQFSSACDTVAATGAVLLEVGPGQSLTAAARQSQAKTTAVVASLGRAAASGSDAKAMADAAGRLWSLGCPVDWHAVHGGSRRNRVPLPSYPFERRRYWVDPDVTRADQADPANEPEEAALPPERAGHIPVWRHRRLDAAQASTEPAVWLVFTRGDGPTELLADQLNAGGATAIRVGTGGKFADLGNGRFQVDPGNRADYDELVRAIAGKHGAPTSVLHGWTAVPAATGPLDFATVDELRETGFYSLLFLTQAWLERWPDRPVDIRVLTSNACNVSGAERVEPGKSLVFGPARVVPNESATVRCQVIDLPLADPDSPVAVISLLTELTTPATDPLVAYRAGRRWVADHEPIELPSHAELPRALRRRGVYLITGGLGGVGLETAKELVRTTGARLVLVGRAQLPAREEWDAYLAAHGDDDPASVRVRGLRELAALGADMMVATADVTDESSMRMVLDAARDRFGRIDGVFHAAGVPGGGLAALRTRDQADQVLAAKVDGTLVIDRLLGDDIDLLVLYSSVIAVNGDYGMVDYCAGNAFLDAFAQAQAHAPSRRLTLSINWCGWEGVGMTTVSAPGSFRRLSYKTGSSPAAADAADGAVATPTGHPLLGDRTPVGGDDIVFSSRIAPGSHWALDEHQMAGTPVFPGVAYAELFVAAYRHAVRPGPVELRELVFKRPLAAPGPIDLRVVGQRRASDRIAFSLLSRPADRPAAGWEEYASATAHAADPQPQPATHDVAELVKRCEQRTWIPDLTATAGPVTFGAHWQVIERVLANDRESLVEIRLPGRLTSDLDDFTLHPAMLDCATAMGLDVSDMTRDGRSYLPFGYDRIVVRDALPERIYSLVRERRGRSFAGPEATPARDIASFDIAVIDEAGRELVTIENFTVHSIDVSSMQAALGATADNGGTRATSRAHDAPSPVRETMLRPIDGVHLTWRILNGAAEPQYVISREPMAARARRIARIAANVAAATTNELASTARRRADRPARQPQAMSQTEERLRRLWMDAFGTDELGLDEDFVELGGNSLVAVQLAVRVRDSFGVTLSGVAVLEHPTVRELAARIDEATSGDLGSAGAAR
jgi:acyl transferase domain-containing protein